MLVASAAVAPPNSDTPPHNPSFAPGWRRKRSTWMFVFSVRRGRVRLVDYYEETGVEHIQAIGRTVYVPNMQMMRVGELADAMKIDSDKAQVLMCQMREEASKEGFTPVYSLEQVS